MSYQNINLKTKFNLCGKDAYQLPHLANATKYNWSICGNYKGGDLPKVVDINANAMIGLNLVFGLTTKQLPCLTGSFKATFIMPCQRCLEPMNLIIAEQIKLVFAPRGTSIDTDDYELIDLTDKILQVDSIIADEILLAMPLLPKHTDNCASELVPKTFVADNPHKPFGILKNRSYYGSSKK